MKKLLYAIILVNFICAIPSSNIFSQNSEIDSIWMEINACVDSVFVNDSTIIKTIRDLSCISNLKNKKDDLHLESFEFKVVPIMIDYYYYLVFDDTLKANILLDEAQIVYKKETRWFFGKKRRKIKNYKNNYDIYWENEDDNFFSKASKLFALIKGNKVNSYSDKSLTNYLEYHEQDRKLTTFNIPKPTIMGKLPHAFFEYSNNLNEVKNDIISSLYEAGYSWRYSVYDIDNGFVIITNFESITENGYSNDDRWDLKIKYDLQNPIDFLSSIFFSKEAFYRSFAFIVTDKSIQTNNFYKFEEINNIASSGNSDISNYLKNLPYTQSYKVNLFVYEYRKSDTDNKHIINQESQLNFEDHLSNSNIQKGFKINLENNRRKKIREKNKNLYDCERVDNLSYHSRITEELLFNEALETERLLSTINEWIDVKVWDMEREYISFFPKEDDFYSYVNKIHSSGNNAKLKIKTEESRSRIVLINIISKFCNDLNPSIGHE